MTERIAQACAAHPRRTLALWGVAVVVAMALVATSLHGLSTQAHVIGSPQSEEAINAIDKAFPQVAAQLKSDVILIRSTRYTATSPQAKAFGLKLKAALAATGQVSHAKYIAVSPDGHSALVSVLIASDSGAKQVEDVLATQSGNGFSALVTGYRSVNYDFGRQAQKDLEGGEIGLGLPVALIILMLVFGAVVAGLVPLLMAILSIIVALGLVAIVSLEFTLSTFTINMLTGMGLALGIDYSLFVVSRYREERAPAREGGRDRAVGRDREPRGAVQRHDVHHRAARHVHRADLDHAEPCARRDVVGITSVAAALTLLPALLSMWGDGINRLRIPYVGRNVGRTDTSEGGFWHGIVTAVLRHPVVALVVSVTALLALALPIFGLHIGANGITTLPDSTPSKQGYLAVQRAFPTQNPEPVRIVAVGGGAATQQDMQKLGLRLAADPQFGPTKLQVAGDTSLLVVPLRGDPVGSAQIAAVRDLRSHTIPTLFSGSDAKVYVGGVTSENIDYFDAVSAPTPYVILFVLCLSFILLTVAFRSIVVALVWVLLNLLSVGAAYGLLTLIFLDGHGAGLFGFTHTPSSTRGCRSSCSRSYSDSRWTTRCSS